MRRELFAPVQIKEIDEIFAKSISDIMAECDCIERLALHDAVDKVFDDGYFRRHLQAITRIQ